MAAATTTTPGQIVMSGDLSPISTGSSPQLRATGVTPGSYKFASTVVDAKGRIIFARSATDAEMAPLAVLPNATTSVKGGVQIDGAGGITSINGVISMPTASGVAFGTLVLGSNITTDVNGDLQITFPNATTSTFGGVQAGTNISISSGVIGLSWFKPAGQWNGIPGNTDNVGLAQIAGGDSGLNVINGVVHARIASGSQVGVCRVKSEYDFQNDGFFISKVDGEMEFITTPAASNYAAGWLRPVSLLPDTKLSIDNDGFLNFDQTGFIDALPVASDTVGGKIKVGSGLVVEPDGTLSLDGLQAATTSAVGSVRIGDHLVMTGNVLSAAVASTTVKGIYRLGLSMTSAQITDTASEGEQQLYTGIRIFRGGNNPEFLGTVKVRLDSTGDLNISNGLLNFAGNIPRKNEANLFTKSQVTAINTVTASASTLAFDSSNPFQEITLTNNVQLVVGDPAGYVPGTVTKLIIKKDTDLRTLTLASAFRTNQPIPFFTAAQQLVLTIITISSTLFLVLQGEVYNI